MSDIVKSDTVKPASAIDPSDTEAALRHAGRTRVHVRVTGADALHVSVRDEGGIGTPDRGGSGHGLRGLRERVALYGGDLRTGRRGEGFEVEALIPWEERR